MLQNESGVAVYGTQPTADPGWVFSGTVCSKKSTYNKTPLLMGCLIFVRN